MDLDGVVKQASTTDLDKAAVLLETIREENPKLWPNGLTVGHFSPGNLWLIQKAASEDPVGFVGWQSRKVEGVPTGYYSIGVLPEYRHQGIAKKAVAQLLATKAASVDHVRALVVEGNTFSERLARSLDVPVEKAAGTLSRFGAFAARHPALVGGAKNTAGGLTNAAFWDYTMAPRGGEGPFKNWYDSSGEFDRKRLGNTFANFLLGVTGTGAARGAARNMRTNPGVGAAEGAMAVGALGAAPFKDLAIYAPNAVEGIAKLPGAIQEAGVAMSKNMPASTGGEGKSNLLPAALIASALGLGAYGLYKGLGGQKSEQQQAGGRLKVTLPTRNPTDSETTIDLPFDQFSALSPALRQRIERDTRRRLHAETNARTRRIGTQALTAVA